MKLHRQKLISTPLLRLLFSMTVVQALSLLLLNAGCSHITVTDHILYGDEEPQGAIAVHTLASVPPVKLTEAQWDLLRPGLICTSTQTIADLKADLEEECSFANNCDYNTNPVAQSHKKAIEFLLNHLNKRPSGEE